MELTITFLAMGIVVLVSTIWRSRRYKKYSNLIEDLCTAYPCEEIDLSGDTRYTNCISFRWTMENLMNKKHSSLGERFQDMMFRNTLTTALWFFLSFGIGILLFGVILVRSIQIAGFSLFIFLIGLFAVLGSGEAKSSELLLDMLLGHEIPDLSEEDYAYATLARDSVKKGRTVSFMVGVILIVTSPWAELAPDLSGGVLATITSFLIWNPTMLLMEISIPLGILYMMGFWPILVVAIIYAIRKIRRSDEETKERAPRV